MIVTPLDLLFGLIATLLPLLETAAILTWGSFMVTDGRGHSREEIWWGKQ